ncbi:aromatic ring-hydroxylating dioxygenase subunit alpha [Pseudonocardia ailaonensis]|uniref:Aromatic ring-hydroxylating dioxygenase subunit alpha n=1 Tax=Pseudonocardia ailaonensis TaxID=367279 RepID=A0ABN2NA41_9PSEU
MTLAHPPLTVDAGCKDPAMLDEWHVIGLTGDFTSGTLYPLRLLERDLVAWRDTRGVLHVWEDLCVHRGAPLSKGWVRDDHVVCPYHGWRYDGSARCTLMPAAPADRPMKKARTFPHPVEERYGLVWTTLGTPTAPVPAFAEWSDPSYHTVVCGPWEFRANGFRSLENFLDATHFPFVHNGTNGNADAPDVIPPYEVEVSEEGLVSSEIAVRQPEGDARGVPVISNYTYSVHRPLVGHLRKRMVDADADWNPVPGTEHFYTNLMTIQPVSEKECVLRVVAAFTMRPGPSDDEVRARLHVVFTEDQEIVERQRPERIPADLRFELHHRTDLMGQRYRQYLRSKKISYGII